MVHRVEHAVKQKPRPLVRDDFARFGRVVQQASAKNG